MNLRAQAAAIKAAMQAIVDRAKAESRDLTDDEATEIEAKATEHDELSKRAEKAEKATRLVAELADSPAAPPAGVDLDDPHSGAAKQALGTRVVKSEAFQSFLKSHPSGVGGGTPVRIEMKNVGTLADIGLKATLDTSFGEARPERLPGYRDTLLYDPLTLLDLITVGRTTSSSLEYAQVTAETDNAAVVAEGALKPLSDITTALADAKVFTYADGFDATNQFLADEAALATFMDGALRRHLRQLIEDLILNGAGGASAPRGILNTTGVQAQAFATDVITTISAAIEKVQTVNADPQAVVMNPSDAWAIHRLKDADGRFLGNGPFSAPGPNTLWGVPIVLSRRVTAGTALVGNFRTVTFLEREPITVLAFNQHKDYAQRNMVYVRAELRAMQLVFSPREIVVADLTA